MLDGTIGTITRFVAVPSSVMCCVRAFIGLAVLILYLKLKEGRLPDIQAMKENLRLLIIAGIMNGLNWLLIFEGFRHTTVAIASICYYMAPVFLIACAPFFFGDSLTLRKLICIAAAFVGMVLVADPFSASADKTGYTGIILSIMAAVAYAANVIATKKLRGISSVDVTAAELLIAGIVLIPYILLTTPAGSFSWRTQDVLLVTLLGVLHTGIGYAVYYSTVRRLKADTIAVLSYIDPVTSVLLSALVLREPLKIMTAAGAVMILGASFFGSGSTGSPETIQDQR